MMSAAALRTSVAVSLISMTILAGCSSDKSSANFPSVTKARPGALIVTPDTSLGGRVVTANARAKFVVMNFQIGRMPAIESQLNVYRRGLKVGEVRVTGPQRDDNIVGDVISGEASTGDEVRDN